MKLMKLLKLLTKIVPKNYKTLLINFPIYFKLLNFILKLLVNLTNKIYYYNYKTHLIVIIKLYLKIINLVIFSYMAH